eukprot:jgi/Chlat1/150/Chrsp1S00226
MGQGARGAAARRIQREIAEISGGGLAHLPGCTAGPQDYPFSPPHVAFRTLVYHCNVAPEDGSLALRMLEPDAWSPAITLAQVMQAISQLLAEPDLDKAVVATIAQTYLLDPDAHDANAREWTRRYAM